MPIQEVITRPFSFKGSSTSLAVTGTTGRVAFPDEYASVRLYNAGSVAVFVKVGTVAVNAATTDLPIPPGATEIFTRNDPKVDTYIAGITASSTATLYISTGVGS